MTTGRKVMVLGLDGMEPYTAKRLMDAGKMPNLKKMVENGAARENLELLGSMPPWRTRCDRLLEPGP